MGDATQKLVDGLRLDAGNYGRMVRGEIEPGETFSWDQSNVRAWEAADALEAAQRPPVSPEQREALDELIADVLIAERDEWPRDPGDAPSDVLAGAVTDAILARFSLPVLDVEKVESRG